MADGTVSLHSQQLLELLAVVGAFPDEASAVHGAVERAAQALEAEVAAVVVDGRITASVGFAAGDVPASDLLAVARLDRSHLDIDGLGSCVATSAGWGGAKPGHLILARWGDEPFAAEERNLVRGMARVLELTLTMLRTLAAEHEQRQRSERHAAENARLLTSLQERQRLLQHLFEIQRAISRRRPLAQILEQVAVAARDLSGDEVVALWLRDPDDTEHARLHASLGLGADAGRLPPVRLADAGVAGQAMLGDAVVIRNAAEPGPDPHVHASIAAPVHESGTVTGSLPIASCRPERVYTDADAEMLRAFAEHVSIALTDAKTVDLMHQAFHDSLTGLASRGLFLDRLAEQIVDAHSRASRVALLFIDLDRFKDVNDTLGHAAGDALLMTTADRLRSELRVGDLAARFGGDEFAVVLSDVAATGEAVAVTDRIIRALREPMLVAGRRLCVNASIGIALSTPGQHDPADLMRRADVAMYQAKRSGRGRYEVYTEELSAAFVGEDRRAGPDRHAGRVAGVQPSA